VGKKLMVGAVGLFAAAWVLKKLGFNLETFLFGPQTPEEEWQLVFEPARWSIVRKS
jgi:hypothetical protein